MFATIEEARAAILTHVCRHYRGLLINPSHCQARLDKANKIMRDNPSEVGFYFLWECLGCSGPILFNEAPPALSPKPIAEEPPAHVSREIKRKKCTGICERVLPATHEYFYTDKKLKDGLFSQCKECVRERQLHSYHKNHKPKRKEGR